MERNDHPMIVTKQKKRRAGFTLIELTVSIALFSVLVSIAAGGFVRALRSERQISAMMSTESNVSIALEEMTREMRTGYLFCHNADVTQSIDSVCGCTSNNALPPTLTCSGMAFYNANGEQVEYFLGNGAPGSTSTILYRSDNGATAPITGDNVQITNLSFTLFGNYEGDHWNPRVTIAVDAEPNDSTVSWSTANLETTVSARTIDCTPNASGVPQC
jgi:prepilin-type N-terminal cleavage/methylation domain-containing protein